MFRHTALASAAALAFFCGATQPAQAQYEVFAYNYSLAGDNALQLNSGDGDLDGNLARAFSAYGLAYARQAYLNQLNTGDDGGYSFYAYLYDNEAARYAFRAYQRKNFDPNYFDGFNNKSLAAVYSFHSQ